MYVVLVTDKELGGTTAYGPFQRQPKANALAALLTTTDELIRLAREAIALNEAVEILGA